MRPEPTLAAIAAGTPMFHVEHGGTSTLPVQDAASFAEATAADDRVMGDMERYRSMLAEASTRMNLVGPSALSEFWPRHAWDSAQLMPLLQNVTRVADIGAGAGFPGIVLAILLKGRAGACVHLVESVAKRSRFLQEVVDTLELPAMIVNARAESLDRPPMAEVVTARACAPLGRLLDYAWPFLRGGARGVFLKGRGAEAELAEARLTWRLKAELAPSRSDPSGRIVLVEEAARVRR